MSGRRRRRHPLPLPLCCLAGASSLAVMACDPPPESDDTPLVVLEAWQELSASEDPFADHRPDDTTCDAGGWGPENGVFEIETDRCPYGSFAQPLGRDLEAGSRLRVTLWHLGLFADPPAEGHVAVLVGGEVLFESWPLIPGDPELWDHEVDLTEDHSAGSEVLFHLHNHGTNSWRLGTIEEVEAG